MKYLMLLVLLPVLGHASQIPYTLDLTMQWGSVETLVPNASGTCCDTASRPAAGLEYSGYFSVDDSILATDGEGMPGFMSAFDLTIEGNTWASGAPGNNSLIGFRGPNGTDSLSLGFDVENGQLDGICGGPYGYSDQPFVDFGEGCLQPTSRQFYVLGLPESPFAGATWVEGGGTYTVSDPPLAVTEPSSLSLLTMGLL